MIPRRTILGWLTATLGGLVVATPAEAKPRRTKDLYRDVYSNVYGG